MRAHWNMLLDLEGLACRDRRTIAFVDAMRWTKCTCICVLFMLFEQYDFSVECVAGQRFTRSFSRLV